LYAGWLGVVQRGDRAGLARQLPGQFKPGEHRVGPAVNVLIGGRRDHDQPPLDRHAAQPQVAPVGTEQVNRADVEPVHHLRPAGQPGGG
jgi:hypothetical protein